MNKAVTLIEMLIIISIISILSVISLTFLRPQLFKGKDAKRKSNLRRMQVVMQEFETDNDCYPADLVACGTSTSSTAFETYISEFPCDPKTKLDYFYEPDTAFCPRSYKIYSTLENLKDPIISELGCDSGCGPSGQHNYFVTSQNVN